MASASSSSPSTLCRERIAKIERKTEGIECTFGNGSVILISPFLATHLSVGDEISFPLPMPAAHTGTEIHVGKSSSSSKSSDVYQVVDQLREPTQEGQERGILRHRRGPEWTTRHIFDSNRHRNIA